MVFASQASAGVDLLGIMEGSLGGGRTQDEMSREQGIKAALGEVECWVSRDARSLARGIKFNLTFDKRLTHRDNPVPTSKQEVPENNL